ncbi:hypothetical protein [Dongia rigui]|uniref:Uncharacterized protein n=1 Tax=Dongia rigui TaxID=940149 RepID=A0ABU5DXG8_9PROT|nr:hypothetical protein [Dongia rigui]MDY0871992.1 hypothetical protein [Dongia rigui]
MKLMQLVIIGSLLALAGTACTSTPSPPLTIGVFNNLKDEHAYWVKAFEVTNEGNPKRGAGFPPAFKSCFADEMIKTSTPELHAAVAAFIRANHTQNFNAIAAALGHPHSSIWTSAPVEAALHQCEPIYFDALYDQFRDVGTYRDFSMTLLKVVAERDGIEIAEYPQEVVECSIDEYWRTLPAELRAPVDIFLRDRSRESWRAVYEKFDSYGNRDKSRTTRLIGHCKAKQSAP